MMSITTSALHEDPKVYARRWFTLGVLCLSLVLVVMSVSGLNVAIPRIQRALGASPSELQWIIDAYGLVFAGVLLSAGAIGDRYGRKLALVSGLGVFAAGAVLSGLAGSAGLVIVGRGITGLGAAFVMPATLSTVTAVFPPEERGRAIAIWAAFAGAGGAIGPIVSGALLERFWWGSALLFNIPVVVVIIGVVSVYVPETRELHAPRLDPPGALLSLVGVSALVFGIIEGPDKGWASGLVAGSFLLAVLTLMAFVAREARSRHPMLPLGLFRDRRFSVGSASVTLSFFAIFAFFFVYSQHAQFVRGDSPLVAGLSTLPAAFALVAGSVRSAALAERFGSGVVIAAGFGITAGGYVVLSFVEPGSPYFVLAAAFVLLGAGIGLTSASATASIMSAVPTAKAGVGSAVNDTTRELGGALGIAVLGSVLNAVYRSSVDLHGLVIPAAARAAATQSIGAARGAAQHIPAGGALLGRAGDAFTHAFNVTSVVSTLVAAAAAIAALAVFSRDAEARAAGAPVDRRPVRVNGRHRAPAWSTTEPAISRADD